MRSFSRRHTGPWLLLLLLICAGAVAAAPSERARILASHPHDPDAFTQGLLVADGLLYESTGGYGDSSLRRVAPASGEVLQTRSLSRDHFGEGLARVGARLYQLTWKAGVAFVYDRDSLARIDRLTYDGQGWGLTYDGTHLIMSDGSATLQLRDPDDFRRVGALEVTEDGQPVDELNELEYIDGEIWANVWYRDRILRIDPRTGDVIASLDATPLRAALPADAEAGVLNGIAYDAAAGRIYATGKNWPRLFEIARPTAGRADPGATLSAE